MLFAKLAFVRAGPVARYWFLWWHALWEGNSEVELFEQNADLLDPDRPEARARATARRVALSRPVSGGEAHASRASSAPKALATVPTPRGEVERLMSERGLDKWVNAKLLDVLYDGLRVKSEGGAAARGGGSVQMTQTGAAAMV